MNINQIKIYRMKDKGLLKAFVNVTMNNAISIKGIKIIDTDEKRFIAMPCKEMKGEVSDIAFPINQDTRSELERLVYDLYEEMVKDDLMIIEKSYDYDGELFIYDIKVRNHNIENSVKAIFDIVINKEYVLKGIKLLFKNDHYFIAMPNRSVKNKYIDCYHPINKNVRARLEDLLIDVYLKSKEGVRHFVNHEEKDITKSTLLDFV